MGIKMFLTSPKNRLHGALVIFGSYLDGYGDKKMREAARSPKNNSVVLRPPEGR